MTEYAPLPEPLTEAQMAYFEPKDYARWLLDVLTEHPDYHDQNVFWAQAEDYADEDYDTIRSPLATRSECGTVACGAGWLNYAVGNHWKGDTGAAAKLLGIPRTIDGPDHVGAAFFSSTNEQFIQILTNVAEGRPADAANVVWGIG